MLLFHEVNISDTDCSPACSVCRKADKVESHISYWTVAVQLEDRCTTDDQVFI